MVITIIPIRSIIHCPIIREPLQGMSKNPAVIVIVLHIKNNKIKINSIKSILITTAIFSTMSSSSNSTIITLHSHGQVFNMGRRCPILQIRQALSLQLVDIAVSFLIDIPLTIRIIKLYEFLLPLKVILYTRLHFFPFLFPYLIILQIM